MGTQAQSDALYPAFVKLAGRPCLVVGAGKIGLEKVEALLCCEAEVTVVSPELLPAFDELDVEIKQRPYLEGEATDYFLVIAATSDSAVNLQVYQDAHDAGRLVNVVDVPHLCDFYVPSIIRKGKLQLAISTTGASPGLAKRLRLQLDEMFSGHYESLLDELMDFRNELKQVEPNGAKRMALNKGIATSTELDAYLDGDPEPLRTRLSNALAPYRNQS